MPIVAKDIDTIKDFIGDVVEVISPGKAFHVRCDPPAPPDERLPIFSHPNVDVIFERDQIWVSPGYTRYRYAWRRIFGNAQIDGKVLHHIYNRRMAKLRGFGFIRLVPISRRANSSSAFTEGWGVDLFTPEYVTQLVRHGRRFQYADLGNLMVMMDISLGGGVQDVMRIGQNLVEVPGIRPPQA